MPRKKPAPKDPGVREMAERIQFTLDLLHRYTYTGDVQQRVCTKYKVTARTARNYISKAKKMYCEDLGDIDKDAERVRLFHLLETIADDRKLDPADKSARMRAVKIQINLIGLAAPTQFEVASSPAFNTAKLAEQLANPKVRKLAQELDKEIARVSPKSSRSHDRK